METFVEVRFIATPGFVEWAIEQVEWSDIDHVEFVRADGRLLGAHSDGGICFRASNYCKPTIERRYKVFVTPEQKLAIETWADAQIGSKYDFANIAGILFHRDWTQKKTFICDYYVAAAFKQAGVNLLNWPKNLDRLTPALLELSPLLVAA